MIKTETYFINGKQFTRTWSDDGRYVVREGVSYNEAHDPTELGRTYTEGEYQDIDTDAEEIVNILTGEAE